MKKLVFATIAVLVLAGSVWAQNMDWYGAGGGPGGKTYHISTEEDLKGLQHLVNYEMDNFLGKTIILDGNITLKEAHTPIGTYSAATKQFRGTFDGGGNSISGLSISGEFKYAGLFGYIGEGGQIKNLTINVSKITTSGGDYRNNDYGGGLAGYYASTKAIENCGVNIRDGIEISYFSGGLVGYASNAITITNSHAAGNISSSFYSGGLVGYANGTLTIANSYTTDSISSSNSYSNPPFSGGLVGYASGAVTITKSHTTGNISSSNSWSNYAGGFVGYAKATVTITDSYATGNVSSRYSGGLVGYTNETLTIINSYTTGNIYSESGSNNPNSFSGGLVGYINGTATITNSYTIGNISSNFSFGLGSPNHFSGGLVGNGNSKTATIKVLNSYSTGEISALGGRRFCGGLIGRWLGIVEIDNSLTEGKIFTSRVSDGSNSDSSFTGGLVGWGVSIKINNSYTRGDVSGDASKNIFSGGLIGYVNNTSSITNSYAIGNINATEGTINGRGGILGRWASGTNKSVYYNNTGASMPAGVGGWPENILGISPENLRQQATFVGWDFNKIWAIDSNINNGYPHLRNYPSLRKKEVITTPTPNPTVATTMPIATTPTSTAVAPATSGIFTDRRDGKKYKTIKIGNQVWMAENLNFSVKGSVCYEKKPENCNKYGLLYNWNTAKTVCPSGWYLPTDVEWNTLIKTIGDDKTAGQHLKAKSGWNNDDKGKSGNGLDTYGFMALPGGYGNSGGLFLNVGGYGNWWSATENGANLAWYMKISYSKDIIDRNSGDKNRLMFSVRCVQD